VPTKWRAVLVVVRWLAVAIGVGLTTFCFVRLVEVREEVGRAAPLWWIGLIGAAVTLLGLGVPWSTRRGRDAAS